MNMTYVCLYADYETTLEPFTFEERGKLLTAMLRYLKTGEDTAFTGNERFIWPTLREQIKRDQEAYDKRVEQSRENGKKGGRPKKNTEAETKITGGFSEKPEKPKEKEKKKEKKNDNKNKNDKDNENENENESESKSENGSLIAADFQQQPPAKPPTLTEVTQLVETKNYIFVDPVAFFAHYQSTGWKQKDGQPVLDWKKEVVFWNTAAYDRIRQMHSQ